MSVRGLDEGPLLVRLTSEDIVDRWDALQSLFERDLPPNEAVETAQWDSLLESFLLGSSQIWGILDEGDFTGMIVTAIQYEFFVRTRNLLLAHVHYTGRLTTDDWHYFIDIIKKFASANRCKFVIGYTQLPHLVRAAERIGADVSWTFIKFNTEE